MGSLDYRGQGATAPGGWAYDYGKGRVCYLSPGHLLTVLWNPEVVKLHKNAVRWLMRQTWAYDYGKGRVCYLSPGHLLTVLWNPCTRGGQTAQERSPLADEADNNLPRASGNIRPRLSSDRRTSMQNMIRRSAMGNIVLAALTTKAFARSIKFMLPALLLLAAASAQTQNSTAAGRFTVEHPTLENLGFEWDITGDANRNASVSVEFRRVGESAWREGLPLVRYGGERIFREREGLDYTVPDGFAGSIFNLVPGTEYEARFELADPDGTSGQTSQTARVTTRTEPQPYAGGRTIHVYPPDYEGDRLEPSFPSLLEAYYGAGLGDWSVVWERRAQPGDTILMHAGLYRNERLNYVDPMVTPFDGTMWLTLDGTKERPITIKAAGDGEVVIDGAGNHRLFDVSGSQYHIFDGITFRDTDVAIFAGMKELVGAVGLTVKNCRFESIGFGVWTEYAGSSDFYIADNIFLGRPEARDLLIGWTRQFRQLSAGAPYGSHEMRSYYAIKIYGPGHVIAHNSVAYFHDAIGISTYGTPEEDPDRRASSIDIYGNDVHMSGDDYMETDGGVHNIRVYNNRGVNAAHSGYSSQPVFGGPVYFIRNLSYNAGNAFKINANPAGLFMWNLNYALRGAPGCT